MPFLFKPGNPSLFPLFSLRFCFCPWCHPSLSWCPSGVQFSAALSADYDHRRYGVVTCHSRHRGSLGKWHLGFWAWELSSVWLECIWWPALSVSSVQLPLMRASLVQRKGRSPCCILFGSGGCGFGVFCTDMPHSMVDRLSFCFGLSWFPGPRNSHILRKTVTEARQLIRCTYYC